MISCASIAAKPVTDRAAPPVGHLAIDFVRHGPLLQHDNNCPGQLVNRTGEYIDRPHTAKAGRSNVHPVFVHRALLFPDLLNE